MAHTYDITIKSPKPNPPGGYDTITFSPADYTIEYTSLAAPNSGRTLDGTMIIEWKARVIPKIKITLPAHFLYNESLPRIISLVQGQEYQISYYDYLKHQKVTDLAVYTSESSVAYSYKTTATDITIEAIAMSPMIKTENVPHYQPGHNTITIATEPSGQGTTSGAGTYTYGTPVQISVTPNSGFSFVKWSDNDMNNPRDIVVTGNATYTAILAAAPVQYTITTNTVGSGSVTLTPSGGTYNAGTTVTLKAIPSENYNFSQWQDGYSNPQRTITVTDNATYTATFIAEPQEYWDITWNDSLTFAVDDPDEGEEAWDVLGTTLPIGFKSNGINFTGIGPDEPGELFYYGGTGVWEGSGQARQWSYSNPNYKVIRVYTNPNTLFVNDWAYFLAANGTVTHHS